MEDTTTYATTKNNVDKLIGELDELVHGFNPLFWLARNIVDTTINVDEPIDESKGVFYVDSERDISDANLVVTYTHEPQYTKRVCGNCKGFTEAFPMGLEMNGILYHGYCHNPNIPKYVLSHIHQTLNRDFGCILWESKESEGE